MKKNLRMIFAILIGATIGILAGIYGESYSYSSRSAPYSAMNPIWALLALYVAYKVQVIVHEFGHFIFGKLVGMHFYSFRVGRLAIERENDQIRLKWLKNKGYAGFCIMLPSKQDDPNKGMMLFLAGGLIMNLCSFLICLYLINYTTLPAGFPTYFIHTSTFISLLLFVSNAWPRKTKRNQVTDGR